MQTQWNTGWHQFDDMFSAFNDLRTRMDSLFDDVFGGPLQGARALGAAYEGWPRANLVDDGNQLVLTAEIPGLSERDVKLTLNQEVVTISGERKVEAPEGYSVHRRERANVNFTRSFALPCRVNADRASATIKDGILTVALEKSADAMPRQITVSAAA
jgi:HSP20 family protein